MADNAKFYIVMVQYLQSLNASVLKSGGKYFLLKFVPKREQNLSLEVNSIAAQNLIKIEKDF